MSDAGTGAAPAGWYEDGVTAGQERYWDGAQWTDQFRPLAPPAPPAPPAPEPVVEAAPVVKPEPVVEAASVVPEPAPVVEPTPVVETPPPAVVPPVPPVQAPPAYPPYEPAGAAPAAAAAAAYPAAPGAYPAYQPAGVVPGAPRKGLSTGAIIGIIIGAVVVVAAIVVVIVGVSTNWFQGGTASSAQQSQFLSNVKAAGGTAASDQDILNAGNQVCEAGRTIIGGDYLGGATKALELYSSNLDIMTIGYVFQYALSDLCPDVSQQLDEMGENFSF